jgi:hypothetical protein
MFQSAPRTHKFLFGTDLPTVTVEPVAPVAAPLTTADHEVDAIDDVLASTLCEHAVHDLANKLDNLADLLASTSFTPVQSAVDVIFEHRYAHTYAYARRSLALVVVVPGSATPKAVDSVVLASVAPAQPIDAEVYYHPPPTPTPTPAAGHCLVVLRRQREDRRWSPYKRMQAGGA